MAGSSSRGPPRSVLIVGTVGCALAEGSARVLVGNLASIFIGQPKRDVASDTTLRTMQSGTQ